MNKPCRFCSGPVSLLVLLIVFSLLVTNFTIIFQTKSPVIQDAVNSLVDRGSQGADTLRRITQDWIKELHRQKDILIDRLDAFEKFNADMPPIDEEGYPLGPQPLFKTTNISNASEIGPEFIPKIIHQTYSSDDNIPAVYAHCIQSCLKVNPDWRYMFWSDEDARNFIEDQYPQFLKMFDKYSNKLLKADAMRYFVLNYYGGLYMDMDMFCLRPIKQFLLDKHMVLTPEPHIQSMMLYEKFSVVTNAIMAASPSHPFMSFVIDRLEHFQHEVKTTGAIYVTGPNMLQTVFEDYLANYTCVESGCSVFVADPVEMMPTVDSYQYRRVQNFIKKCATTVNYKSYEEFKTCEWVRLTGYKAEVTGRAYTNHLWKHLGYKTRYYGWKKKIRNIVGPSRTIERYERRRKP